MSTCKIRQRAKDQVEAISNTSERVNLKAILADPVKRRELMIKTMVETQAAAGVPVTYEQAASVYDAHQEETRTTRITDSTQRAWPEDMGK